jgi:hypothetical protein
MIDKYEAAEVIVIGRAQDVILGEKDVSLIDNRPVLPFTMQDSPVALFDE